MRQNRASRVLYDFCIVYTKTIVHPHFGESLLITSTKVSIKQHCTRYYDLNAFRSSVTKERPKPQGCKKKLSNVSHVTKYGQRCSMSQGESRMSRVTQWSPGYHMSQKVVRDITCHTIMFSPWRWRWRNASVALGFHFSSFWQGLRSFLQCEWQVYS